ncbi:MAG: SPOR domain-containing protein [Gammaproteobacteria bacterium]
MHRPFRMLVVLLLALVLAGCGELQDWRSTQRADTLEAYEAFVEQYPQSQYVPVAQRRLADLVEQRDWLIATESDTAEGYRAFINNHPKGRWTREARVRLQNFLSTPGVLGPAALEPVESPEPPGMLPSAPAPLEDTTPGGNKDSRANTSADTGANTSASASADTSADSPPAAPPVAAPAVNVEPAPVTHRIQLGAYSSRDKALEAWREVRARHVELQGLVSQAVLGSNGKVEIYRLQASVASEERAREICRVLLAARQGCVYVPPGR